MKTILMSIKPQWCEKIFSGEKIIENRKTTTKLYADRGGLRWESLY